MKSLSEIPSDLPVVIAGPTASGKSALALALAEQAGGIVVNADALQVWSCWQLLSARPSGDDIARAPHALYGYLQPGDGQSVGHWLRALAPILADFRAGHGPRPVIVGGTGLYLSALTEGLAEIPAIPDVVRARANALRLEGGQDGAQAVGGLAQMIAALDAETRARIDLRNPMRVQRAWEVQEATGRGLAAWQAAGAAPLLPRDQACCLQLLADRDWLADRIDRRFDAMLAAGALDEARAVLPIWDETALWARCIGAPELVAHLQGRLDLAQARSLAQAASRQYAKRQRSWFRARMGEWRALRAEDLGALIGV